VLNGRVSVRATVTGVERWAIELFPRLRAIDPARYLELRPPDLAGSGVLGHAWEQLVLPRGARRLRASLIFSPANLAPLSWRRNVVLVHDAAPLRFPEAYSRAYRAWHHRAGVRSARRALGVVTVSEFSKQELVGLLDLDPRRVTVIRGAVDGRFHPDADPARVRARHALHRPYVLTIGANDRRKNLAALHASARELERLGIELVRAGDTRAHFTTPSSAAGVRSLGYVAEDDLPGLYAGAQAFVLPSLYEGLGLPCLEAMACGIPVVAADRAALPETCGEAALLVDPTDATAIAEALRRVVSDERLRAQLRHAGLTRATTWTWEQSARVLDDLLVALAHPA